MTTTRLAHVTSPQDNLNRNEEALALLDGMGIQPLPQDKWTGKHYDGDIEQDPELNGTKADDLFAELESKVRRVASQAGEERYHAPIGTVLVRVGRRNVPVSTDKVNKVEVRHGGKPQVVQHVKGGELVTEHDSLKQAEDHIDAILNDHPNVGSVHHTFQKGLTVRLTHAGAVHYNDPNKGNVRLGSLKDDNGPAVDQMESMLADHLGQPKAQAWSLTTPKQRLDYHAMDPKSRAEYEHRRAGGMSHARAMRSMQSDARQEAARRSTPPKEGGSIMARRSQGAMGGGAAQNAPFQIDKEGDDALPWSKYPKDYRLTKPDGSRHVMVRGRDGRVGLVPWKGNRSGKA